MRLNIPRSDAYKLQIAMMYEIVHRNGELFAQLDALFGTKRINCNALSLVLVIVNIGWVPLFFPTHSVGYRHNIYIYIFIYSLLFFFVRFLGGPLCLLPFVLLWQSYYFVVHYFSCVIRHGVLNVCLIEVRICAVLELFVFYVFGISFSLCLLVIVSAFKT